MFRMFSGRTHSLIHVQFAVWHLERLRRIATSVGSGPASGSYPSVLHGLELCLHSSAPGVSWSSPLALSFRCPVKGCASDVVLLSPHDVPNPIRMMMVSMLSWLQRASSCWLEMVSGQKICRILLRIFVWKTDSLVILLSVVVGWTSHSFGRSSAWSWRSTEKTSTRCWAFWRRFWPCWDGSWCHPLLDHHALLRCPGKWTL